MCASRRPAAGRRRQRDQPLRTERVDEQRRPDHVDDRVHRANLVKFHLFRGNAVDLSLGAREQRERVLCQLRRARRQARLGDQVADLPPRPVRVVLARRADVYLEGADAVQLHFFG